MTDGRRGRARGRAGFKSRILLAIGAMVSALLLGAGAALAASAVDQRQTASPTNDVSFTSVYPIAQTFVAGQSGMLDRVALDLFAMKPPSGESYPDVNVEVRATSAGHPTDVVLGDAQVQPGAVLGDPGFTGIPLASPAKVVDGRSYAIVLSTDRDPFGQGTYSVYFWKLSGTGYAADDSYPGGRIFTADNSNGGSFEPLGSSVYDLRFKTFVDSPATAP